MIPAEARRFVSLFGGARETSDLVGIAKAACNEGYAVIPIRPMGKEAMCTLTERQARAADQMAANAAREAGKGHWERARHDCGLTHAITDPKDAERVFRRLVTKHPDLNIALELSHSRLICVDSDNLDEVASFTALWAQRDGIPELASAAPTVRSPGKVNPEGTWVHKDGGHFWFLLPGGVEFIDSPIATSMPIGAHEAKAQVKFSRSYVLVPPSVREEGPYVMASDISPAPQWLIDELYLHVEEFMVRRDRQLEPRDGTDSIDVWSSVVTWEELLLGDGWTTQGRPDNCGCTIWTRPGDWSSPKSATAHEPGCTRWDTDSVGHGFLHIWTDSPPAFLADYIAARHTKSLSKLQYIAWRDFGGNDSEAMRALGIQRTAESGMTDDEVFAAAAESMNEANQGKALEDGEDPEEEDDEPELNPFQKLRAEFISAADLDKIPPLAPLVDGLLDLKTTTRVIGQSGHGKTFVMLDLAAHVVTGSPWLGRECTKGRVAYIVAEGVAGFTKRVRAWEEFHSVKLGDGLMSLPRPVQAANVTEWAVLVEVLRDMAPSLVVIDTQARVTVGMEENSAKDMGLFVDRADRIKTATGACVVLVHHQGHTGDQGRGSSAVLGALDAEIAVSKEAKGRIAVLSSKQKDREDFEPIRLELSKVGESAVLVALGQADPGTSLLGKVIDEESTPRDRIAKLIYQYFNEGEGGTKAEIKKVVAERDKGPRGKPMDTATFYRGWAKLEGDQAVIKNGTRYGLAKSEAVALGLCEATDSPRLRSIQGEDVDQ
jgi:hypothetical protein